MSGDPPPEPESFSLLGDDRFGHFETVFPGDNLPHLEGDSEIHRPRGVSRSALVLNDFLRVLIVAPGRIGFEPRPIHFGLPPLLRVESDEC